MCGGIRMVVPMEARARIICKVRVFNLYDLKR